MSQPELVARDQTVSRRVMFEGRITKVVDYFGGAAPLGGVQAYLVEQRNYTLRPHFHPVDQFQILCAAPGSRFGRRPVDDLTVHYADAHTVYGPLVGGEPPLRYFTLRAEPTDATRFMPESRALLPGRPGRSLHAEVGLAPAHARTAAAPASSALIEDVRDGLGVSRLTAGPGARIALPDPGPRGQFLFVAAGEVSVGGTGYGPESIGWQESGGRAPTVVAGAEGAVVVTLRYPRR